MIFRLGRLNGVRGPRLVYIIPIVERCVTVNIRTKTLEVSKQEVITTDNAPVSINAICYYKIVDSVAVVMRIHNYNEAVFQLAQATTRSVVGQSELDEILSKHHKLNLHIQAILEEFVDDWGLEVETVEIKDVSLSDMMKRAMARQAEAETHCYLTARGCT